MTYVTNTHALYVAYRDTSRGFHSTQSVNRRTESTRGSRDTYIRLFNSRTKNQRIARKSFVLFPSQIPRNIKLQTEPRASSVKSALFASLSLSLLQSICFNQSRSNAYVYILSRIQSATASFSVQLSGKSWDAKIYRVDSTSQLQPFLSLSLEINLATKRKSQPRQIDTLSSMAGWPFGPGFR